MESTKLTPVTFFATHFNNKGASKCFKFSTYNNFWFGDTVSYIYCDPQKCTGCRVCELVCVGFHDRISNPKAARIRVVRSEPAFDVALTCRQCANAPCMAACPTGAIFTLKGGLVEVKSAHCIGCGACVEACPFGAIVLFNGKAIKCDLCGGDPQCVKQCVPGAIKLVTSEQVVAEKRLGTAKQVPAKKV